MTNLGWGLQITALGMGLVFGLLALLWGLLTLALRLDAPPPAREETLAEPPPAPLDPALVAAITVAVLAHTQQRRGEAAPHVRIHWPGSLLHASRWVAAGRTRQTQTWHRGR
jgi:Na+-transporting methylmalonyl-CoA/oxaloacetate decarboxylase gamma subunit